jgi:hypothetical protein
MRESVQWCRQILICPATRCSFPLKGVGRGFRATCRPPAERQRLASLCSVLRMGMGFFGEVLASLAHPRQPECAAYFSITNLPPLAILTIASCCAS